MRQLLGILQEARLHFADGAKLADHRAVVAISNCLAEIREIALVQRLGFVRHTAHLQGCNRSTLFGVLEQVNVLITRARLDDLFGVILTLKRSLVGRKRVVNHACDRGAKGYAIASIRRGVRCDDGRQVSVINVIKHVYLLWLLAAAALFVADRKALHQGLTPYFV